MKAEPCPPDEGKDRVLLSIRRYDGQRWSPPEYIRVSDAVQENNRLVYTHRLQRGGTLRVFPNFVTESISENDLPFRQYTVQNNNERRVHCALSCTDNDPRMPCYKYHTVTTRAAAHISNFPSLHRIAQRGAQDCGVDSWKIGAMVLLYRNQFDKNGFHSDDTCGETTILCAILQSLKVRPLVVRTKTGLHVTKSGDDRVGDERIHVYAAQGDAYCMDGASFYRDSIDISHDSSRRNATTLRPRRLAPSRKNQSRHASSLLGLAGWYTPL